MEIVKNIAAVVGCISACTGLVITIFKPIRKAIINGITNKQRESEVSQKLDNALIMMKNVQNDIVTLNDRVDEIGTNVLENEKDRLKSELFNCGNRCRRGIILYPEEMGHIRDVYHKYNEVLKQNHDGTLEYEFILKYYNSQAFNNNETK